MDALIRLATTKTAWTCFAFVAATTAAWARGELGAAHAVLVTLAALVALFLRDGTAKLHELLEERLGDEATRAFEEAAEAATARAIAAATKGLVGEAEARRAIDEALAHATTPGPRPADRSAGGGEDDRWLDAAATSPATRPSSGATCCASTAAQRRSQGASSSMPGVTSSWRSGMGPANRTGDGACVRGQRRRP